MAHQPHALGVAENAALAAGEAAADATEAAGPNPRGGLPSTLQGVAQISWEKPKVS